MGPAVIIRIAPPIRPVIIPVPGRIEAQADIGVIPGVDGIAPVRGAVLVIVVHDDRIRGPGAVGGGQGVGQGIGDGRIPGGPIVRVGVSGSFRIASGIQLGIAAR
jgi:hypothetical protein